MAYDRYDTREGPRDERGRWRGAQHERGERYGRDDDRGFFERAGDEIASWFGDEEAERRRRDDQRMYEREGGRGWSRDGDRDRRRGRDENRSGGFFGRGDFDRDDDRYRGGDFRGRDRDSSQFFAASGYARGGFGPEDFEQERRSRGRGYSRSQIDREWIPNSPGNTWQERDPEGRSRMMGGSAGYGYESARSRDYDPHYHSWRQRQLDELDRDYEDYRRERQSQFEDDFGSWREQRMQKRGLLGRIREHMEVVGSDEQHVGTVDRVAGDRIILTKSDPESGGVHHSLSCADIASVEGDRILLAVDAEQAKQRWRDESRERALFEREDQGEMGDRVLDRSFSGTYR